MRGLGLSVVLSAVIACAHASPLTVTDDRGRQLTLPSTARRIVALAPSITELAYAAGAGPRLVGVARGA